jgi:hypothetical protein
MPRLRGLFAACLFTIVAGCGGGGGSAAPAPPPTTLTPDPPTAPTPEPSPFTIPRAVAPAVADGPWADVLVRCLVDPGVDGANGSCTTATLPLLGQETDAPTLDEVMERVLVAEPWMAEQLRSVLQRLPPETLRLFRSVTGVLVGPVRPSFYTTGTGALYLDSLYLARDGVELGDVDTDTPDFRADFGNGLRFEIPFRYVSGDRQVGSGDLAVGTRQGAFLLTSLVLYHELAHAADFFPPDRLAAVDRGTPIAEVRFPGERISDDLRVNLPLRSSVLRGAAGVRFLGDAPTDAERALTPEEIADEFALDGAVDFYAYATPFEDLATTAEAFWARHALGLERDVVVIPRVAAPERCTDLPVIWGMRDRILEPGVLERLRIVLGRVLPEASDALLSSFGDGAFPRLAEPGSNLCEIRFADGTSASLASPDALPLLQGTVVEARRVPVLLRPDGDVRAIH